MNTTIEALGSTGYTPITPLGKDERDYHRRVGIIMDKFNGDETLNKAVQIMAKDDLVVKSVWNHYAEQKAPGMLPIAEIQHFWDKVSATAADLHRKGGNNDN